MWKNYTILILIFIIILLTFFSNFKYNKIEKEYLDFKSQQEIKDDSLKKQNDSLLFEIDKLYDAIRISNYKIDSLKNIKQQILIQKEFIISEDLTESVLLLKKNLRCE